MRGIYVWPETNQQIRDASSGDVLPICYWCYFPRFLSKRVICSVFCRWLQIFLMWRAMCYGSIASCFSSWRSVSCSSGSKLDMLMVRCRLHNDWCSISDFIYAGQKCVFSFSVPFFTGYVCRATMVESLKGSVQVRNQSLNQSKLIRNSLLESCDMRQFTSRST